MSLRLWRQQDENLFDAVAVRAMDTLPAFLILNMTNTFWAFAAMGFQHPPFVNAIADELLKRIDHIYGQAISATAWSCAKLVVVHQPLMYGLATAAVSNIGACAPQNLANTAWAFAKLLLKDEALMGTISAEMRTKLAEAPMDQWTKAHEGRFEGFRCTRRLQGTNAPRDQELIENCKCRHLVVPGRRGWLCGVEFILPRSLAAQGPT